MDKEARDRYFADEAVRLKEEMAGVDPFEIKKGRPVLKQIRDDISNLFKDLEELES